jgi:hypothetical protein
LRPVKSVKFVILEKRLGQQWPNMMSQRRCFVSEFGGVLFPSLAVFCFRVWRCFVSEFGGILFPSLAVFEMVEFLGELCW